MDINIIKSTIDLLKKTNASNYVTIVELARELKTQKTKVMQFLEENSKLFILSHRWAPKQKTVVKQFQGVKYKHKIQVRGRDLGTCIEEVFLTADQNYLNDEWVEKMRVEKAKYLYIKEADNYGYIEGYYFDLDTERDTKYRYYLWRNTKNKLDSISEFTSPSVFTVGGFGDSSRYKKQYGITLENINKLKEKGWMFNNFKPLS